MSITPCRAEKVSSSARPDRIAGFHHQDEWDLVALKAAFDPQRAKGLAVRAQFVADSIGAAWVNIRDQGIDIGLGEDRRSDITINGTVEDLFLTAREPAALLAAGSRKKLNQFMSAFAL